MTTTQDVVVITGGGSGMGLAAARLMGNAHVVLAGRTAAKLDAAVAELAAASVSASAFVVDVADEGAVCDLAAYASGIGPVRGVIHAAGLSPHQGTPEAVVRVNALGSLFVNDAFLDVLTPGGCVVDVSSMSAHLTPRLVLPRSAYPVARRDSEKFVRRVLALVRLFPAHLRSSIAYGISKDFVVWLARTDAARFGERGLRVLSVSPGNVDTPIGDAEADRVAEYIDKGAIKRLGRPEEIAELLAFCVTDKASFITGTDILCDGGLVAAVA